MTCQDCPSEKIFARHRCRSCYHRAYYRANRDKLAARERTEERRAYHAAYYRQHKRRDPACPDNPTNRALPDRQDIRRDAMLQLLDTGEYTLAQIGARFGLSRQRVQQIYIEQRGMNYQPVRRLFKRTHPKRCSVCDEEADGSQGMCRKHYDRWRYHSSEEVRRRHNEAMMRWNREHREERREYNRVYHKLYYHRKKSQETAEQREQRRAYNRMRSKLYYQRKKAEALERERR